MKKIALLVFVLFCTSSLLFGQNASDLFFSEYIEGTSNNKALEIFNGTGGTVDLSQYRVTRSNNGSTDIQDSLNVSVSIANGDVYVIANPSAVTDILDEADTTSTITFYNGDDVLQLQKNDNGTWVTIDVIGTLGEDPGTAWPVAGVANATAEYTLIRKSSISQGNTNWVASAGTDADNSEWIVLPQNNFDNIGSHDFEGGVSIISIAEAIEDLDNDYRPDRLGDTVTVAGVIISPNFQVVNNDYYLYDGTAGTNIFMYGPPVFNLSAGDSIIVTGKVDQYNGKSEVIPLDSASWTIVSSGNDLPEPVVLTLGQFLANPEMYEGSLVAFKNLTRVSGNWPNANQSVNLSLSDGIDTVVFRVDGDTDIDGQPEPTWPQDVIGIGSQFDNSAPYSSGYQVFPRYFASDFLPGGTLPVELVSFTASVSNNAVRLNWATATEKNNSGFEIERKSAGGNYEKIAFVTGSGTTTESRVYSYVDSDVHTGKYTYRLKQVDFDGSFAYSNEVEVDAAVPSQYTLEQNFPNPFNPATTISFNLPVDAKVKLRVYDVLGKEIQQVVDNNLAAGNYSFNVNFAAKASGVYFYRLEANGIDGSNFTSMMKMILNK